jgi:hypothetical protein
VQARIPAHPPPRLSQRSRAVLTRRSCCALARKVDCVSWSAEGMLAVVSGSTVHPHPVHLPSPCRARYACAARRAHLSTTHTASPRLCATAALGTALASRSPRQLVQCLREADSAGGLDLATGLVGGYGSAGQGWCDTAQARRQEPPVGLRRKRLQVPAAAGCDCAQEKCGWRCLLLPATAKK